ncbi:MAG: hypothetical protein ACK47B_18615 [Armatimonadota bacterium]
MATTLSLRFRRALALAAALTVLLPVFATPAEARRGRGGDDRGVGDDRGGDRGGDDDRNDDGGGRGRGRGGDDRGGSRGRIRNDYRLVPTAAGEEDGLFGKARLEARSDRFRLRVQVKTPVLPQGTVLQAYALVNGAGGVQRLFLGSLVLQPSDNHANLMEDKVDLRAFPSGITSPGQVAGFEVTDQDSTVTLLTSVLTRSRSR